MAASADRLERFRREAKALAALDHPGIVTVFSVEEAEGVHFLTMQLIEGQALDSAIPEGGMPVQRVLDIAHPLADALATAHDKGIVHRDLKPANVMITTDGRVKVLDFGLAKELREADPMDVTLASSPHTEIGVVMGTPAYMSPEQVVGAALDHRTDIFSLGVLLYEMVTGRRPFQGRSSAETTSAILRDTPAAVTDVRADVPGDLARIIRRCLEKDPRHRIQTARDVANELRDLARQNTESAPPAAPLAPRAAAAPDSGASRTDEGFWVAVLPFRHGGIGGDIAALADALSEGIVMGMLRFPYLRVIARSSTLRYTSETTDVRAIGSELGARYVIDGTLRQAGSKVRIAVQLVDTQSGAHLWAETYDRPFSPEGILELQDDLVPRIVSTVADAHGVLPRTLGEALRNRSPEELSPYEAVLRSFSYFERLSLEEFVASRTALERAVALAPGYSYAWAALALIIENEYTLGLEGKPDPLGRGLQAARKAVEADPSNHRAHQVLAEILFYRREIPAFRTSAKRALELNSMDSCGVAGLGGLIAYAGEWERGCALVHQALRLNPHHPGWYWFPLVFDAYRQGDYRNALDLALRIELPGYRDTQMVLAAVHGQLGEYEAATRCLQELLALAPQFALDARTELGKFLDPGLVEHVIDGLRKAGLEIAGDEGPS